MSMGCRLIVGVEQGTEQHMAVLFDSTDGIVFGPVIRGETEREALERGERFIDSLEGDPRRLTDVELSLAYWLFCQREEP